jgi:uncharacterized protein (DUF1778 family)
MVKKKASGGKRLKEQGRSLIWVSPTEDEKKKIRMAAAYKGVPMSEFLLQLGVTEADRILEKLQKTLDL